MIWGLHTERQNSKISRISNQNGKDWETEDKQGQRTKVKEHRI